MLKLQEEQNQIQIENQNQEPTVEELNELVKEEISAKTEEDPAFNPELRGMRRYLQEITRYSVLSAEEEDDLVLQIRAGSIEARHKLVNSNLRLVVNIAKHYMGRGVDLEELVAYGNIGLTESVDRFDETAGYRFSTYATYWIRLEIKNGISEVRDIIRKPGNVITAMGVINAANRELVTQLGREGTPEEISRHIKGKYTAKQIKDAQDIVKSGMVASLDKKLDASDKESDTVGDMIADDEADTPIAFCIKKEREEILADAVNALDPKFKMIIKMRYGIGYSHKEREMRDPKIYTLEEVSQALYKKGFKSKTGKLYSKEYVRQLEEKALAALRENPQVQGIWGDSNSSSSSSNAR